MRPPLIAPAPASLFRWLLALLLLALSLPTLAACSSWNSKVYLNEYFYGSGSDASADFLELYSTDNTYINNWTNWSVEVYPAVGSSTSYTFSAANASACKLQGETWVTYKTPLTGPSSLPTSNLLVLLKDNLGLLVDAFVFAGSDSKADDVYTTWGGLLSSCPTLQTAINSQRTTLTGTTTLPYRTANMFVDNKAGNKDLMRSPNGGTGLGNPWSSSLYSGAGSSFSQCTSNNGNFTKSVSASYVAPGDPLTYTLNVVNVSNQSISTIQVVDNLPAELTTAPTVSATSGTATVSSGSAPYTVTWNIPSVAKQTSANLTINVVVPSSTPAGTTLVNTASTTSGVSPQQSDIAITEVIDPQTPSFAISAPASASTCAAGGILITVTAMSQINGGGSRKTDYVGTVTFTTSNSQGVWTKATAAGTLTGSGSTVTYTFASADQGQASFYLSGVTSAGTVSVAATDASTFSPSIMQGQSGGISYSANETLAISDADNLSPTNIAVAGRPHRMKFTITPACSGNTSTPTGTISFAAWAVPTGRSPSASPAPSLAASATSAGCSSPASLGTSDPVTTNMTVSFTSGVGYAYLCTSDVGQYTLYARIPKQTPLVSNAISGNTSTLTVRPFTFRVSNTSGATLVGTANPSGTVFKKAGETFPVKIAAVLWNATDDAETAPVTIPITLQGNGIPDSTNFAASSAANNFGKETPAHTATLSHSLYAPAGGIAGTLHVDTYSTFINGASSGNNGGLTSWDEVGAITLTAALTGGNYMNSGATISGSAAPVGRFTPDHFHLAASEACSSGNFTYSRQPTAFTAYARNSTGDETRNFDSAKGFSKALGPLSPSPASASFASPTIPATAFASGIAPVELTLQFGTEPSAPSSYTFTGADTDGIAISTAPTLNLRSGRVSLQNVYGSERLPLSMPLALQYYTGSYWTTNTIDSCTQFLTTASGSSSLAYPPSPYTSNTTASACYGLCTSATTANTGASATDYGGTILLDSPTGTMTATASTPSYPALSPDSTTFNAGSLSLSLGAPLVSGSYRNGSLDLILAVPPWLQFNGSNPKAKLNFGIYNQQGNAKKIIYRREVR